jgi:hypothetical protein
MKFIAEPSWLKDTINQLKTAKANLNHYCEETFRIACNMITLADTMVEDVKKLVTSIADPTPSQADSKRSSEELPKVFTTSKSETLPIPSRR